MIPKTINDDSSQNNKDEFFSDLKKDITTSVLVEFAFKEVNKSMEGLDDETKVKQKLTEELETKISNLKKIDIEKRAKDCFYIKEDRPYKKKFVAVSLAIIILLWVMLSGVPLIKSLLPGGDQDGVTGTPTVTQTLTEIPTDSPTPTPPVNDQTSFINDSFINDFGMKFVQIPEGYFDMGSPDGEKDRDTNEGPIRRVTFKKAFNMSRYEVTQKQWREVMGKDNNPSGFIDDNRPVEQVSWNNVQDFIKKLNENESKHKYRLPSEAEWEYASRAGNKTRYSFGDDESKLGEYAWYAGNSDGKTHPVGEKKPNLWGLYDMHGNVNEWVQDEWYESYYKAPKDGSAWETGDDLKRVYRGGSWFDSAKSSRSAKRTSMYYTSSSEAIGFRLVSD